MTNDVQEKVGDTMGAVQDYYARKVLERATSQLNFSLVATYKKPNLFVQITNKIKWKIKEFRIWLAEIIGGDALHENCGDY